MAGHLELFFGDQPAAKQKLAQLSAWTRSAYS